MNFISALQGQTNSEHGQGGGLDFPVTHLDISDMDTDTPFPEELEPSENKDPKQLFHYIAKEVYQNNQKHHRPLHFNAVHSVSSPSTNSRVQPAKRSKEGLGTLPSPGSLDTPKTNNGIDYFLMDHDPTWIRNRVTKQVGGGGSDFVGAGSEGLFTDAEGDGSVGGLAAEMTIDRKVNRKFQTQGWK